MNKLYNLMIGGEIGINGTPIKQQKIVDKLNDYEEMANNLGKIARVLLDILKIEDVLCDDAYPSGPELLMFATDYLNVLKKEKGD